MERYTSLIICTAGVVLMLVAMSAYSFTNSPEYQFYSQVENQSEMLPQPDESMLLSQK